MPEFITLTAAVRMGSVTLGIGGIVHTPGTLYAAAGPAALVLLGSTALITAVLALGLVVRDTRGVGSEGIAIPGIHLGTVALAILAT